MGPILDLLWDLEDKGVRVSASGGQLLYRAVPGMLTADERGLLKARRREILDFLPHFRPLPALTATSPSAQRVPSRQQEGWWQLMQRGVMTGSRWANQCTVLRIRDELDVSVLERTCTEIRRRHEVLCARFRQIDGRLTVSLDPDPKVHVAVTDLSHLPEGNREMEALALAMRVRMRPFASLDEDLFRVELLRLSRSYYALIFVAHHIVFDGHSKDLLLKEFRMLYPAFAGGGRSPLRDLPVQYFRYSAWQHDWLPDAQFDAYVAQARVRLGRPLVAPAESISGERSELTAFCRFHVYPQMLSALDVLAKQVGATKQILLLAAFMVTLSAWTEQSHIGIGVLGNDRTRHPELFDLLGYFVVFDPLNLEMDGNPSLLQIAEHVAQSYLNAVAHRIPFSMQHVALNPGHHPAAAVGGNPCSASAGQISVVMNYNPDYSGYKGIELGSNGSANARHLNAEVFHLPPAPPDKGLSTSVLMLYIFEVNGGIDGAFVYSSARFGEASMEKLRDMFLNVADCIVRDGSVRLNQLITAARTTRH